MFSPWQFGETHSSYLLQNLRKLIQGVTRCIFLRQMVFLVQMTIEKIKNLLFSFQLYNDSTCQRSNGAKPIGRNEGKKMVGVRSFRRKKKGWRCPTIGRNLLWEVGGGVENQTTSVKVGKER